MSTGGKIEFDCSHCGKSLSVDASKAGRTGRCPACQAALTVPEPVDIGFRGDDEGMEEELALACPHCNQIIHPDWLVAGFEQRCAACGGAFQVPEGFDTPRSHDWRRDDGGAGTNASSASFNANWHEAARAFHSQGQLPITAAIEVQALGGWAFWKFAVAVDGVEHDLRKKEKRLIPVTSGSHSVEFFVRAKLMRDGRGIKNQTRVNVGDGMVQAVSFKILNNPIESIRHMAQSLVIEGDVRQLTAQEASSLGIDRVSEGGQRNPACGGNPFCSNCGASLGRGAKFCGECGTRAG